MEKVKLSNTLHDAPWVDNTLFPHPLYTEEAKQKRDGNDNENWKYIAIWPRDITFIGRYTHFPTYNIEGIENMYGPYYLQFHQSLQGHWIISFKSEIILQSKYLKMTDEEMQKVLAKTINY